MGRPTPGKTIKDPATDLNSASPGPMKLRQFKFFKDSILGWAFYCSFYNSVYNLYDTIKWKTQEMGAKGNFNSAFQGEAVRKGDMHIQLFSLFSSFLQIGFRHVILFSEGQGVIFPIEFCCGDSKNCCSKYPPCWSMGNDDPSTCCLSFPLLLWFTHKHLNPDPLFLDRRDTQA